MHEDTLIAMSRVVLRGIVPKHVILSFFTIGRYVTLRVEVDFGTAAKNVNMLTMCKFEQYLPFVKSKKRHH